MFPETPALADYTESPLRMQKAYPRHEVTILSNRDILAGRLEPLYQLWIGGGFSSYKRGLRRTAALV
jgi:hypothetical protein